MLLRIDKETYVNSAQRKCKRNVYVYKCDQCKQEFTRTHRLKGSRSRLHFCNTRCVLNARKKGGVLCNAQERTNVERYGAERPIQSPMIEQKRRKTCVERYGGENPMCDQTIRTSSINTMRSTFKERYGVEHPLQVKEFADKAHKKAFETFEKHGVKSPAQMPGAKEKIEATCIQKYGTKNAMQNPVVNAKALATKERKGINLFKTTKIEARILQALQIIFGNDDVQHPKWFNKHPVDFYIKSIDVWIEHDGEFWHGLSKASKKYLHTQKRRAKDQVQDELFKSLNMKLIRIYYSEVKSLSDSELEKFLLSKIMENTR